MTISLVAAKSENDVIGNKGALPWKRVPADMKHIREITKGQVVVMGSQTARSMMRYQSPILSDCPIIVLTRGDGEEFTERGFAVAHSLEDALSVAEESGEEQVCIFGGGQIYAEAIQKDIVHQVHLTLIHTVAEGDTFFPSLTADAWKETGREQHPADEKNPYPYDFITYERVAAEAGISGQ